MASPVANGASSEANGSTSRSSTAGHQQGKPSFAAKMSEMGRKADDETSQRRTSQQPKAWTSGVNPITQRSNTPSQMNGAGGKAANASDKSMDRQTWMFASSVGLQCTISLKGGEKFSGIFSGAQKAGESQKVVFKMVKEVPKNGQSSEFTGTGPEHVMIFPVNSLESFEVPEAPILTRNAPNGAQGSFRTDTDISGNLTVRERNLQRWEAPSVKGVDMSLESATGGEWDQFKANEERFGVKSDYDENIYTTTIDYKDPLYSQKAREAERIAREIEGSAATNAHVREERGLDDGAGDEEEKYSGVRRDHQPLESNQPNRYIPPSKRNAAGAAAPPTTAPTKPAAEAAVDPAIISSQIARSEAPAEPPKPATSTAPSTTGLTINTTASAKESKPSNPSGKGVATDVLDSFRQFAATEKMKVQDQKRSKVIQDKAVKLNDLMKFSKNFKLLTPVPKDLVPILAKDETKQKEIVQKAQLNAQSSAAKSASVITDQKSSRPLAAARWDNDPAAAAAAAAAQKEAGRTGSISQTSTNKDRPAANQTAAYQPPQGSLSTKLNNNHQAHNARVAPQALPLQESRKNVRGNYANLPSPQKGPGGQRGPPSATSLKFNAKAMEFNPNANAFKPNPSSMSGTTVASSPRSVPTTRTISPAGPPPSILGDRKDFNTPESKDPSKETVQMPIDPDADGKGDSDAKAISKTMASNGGFPPAYRTHPTWPVDDLDNGPDFKAIFDELRPKRHFPPQPHPSPGSGMAHQYQLPPHLQQGNHGAPHSQPPHHTPHQPPQQPHHFNHGQHFEDNHMRPSHSQSSYAPSPRMSTQSVNYQSPMPQNAHLAYPHTMQYPPQAHPMGQRQFSNPPQMIHVQSQHLAPMMVPPGQPGFMPQQVGVPFGTPQQIPIYATPGAQPMYSSPGQPPSGYPSPGRGAPMMIHQGSQQGQQPVYMPQHGQYGQPVYAQHPPQMPGMRGGFGSPQPPYAQSAGYPPHQQQHHFPHQPHRTPSSGFAQPHQPHQHNMQPQSGPPQPSGPAEMTEDAK